MIELKPLDDRLEESAHQTVAGLHSWGRRTREERGLVSGKSRIRGDRRARCARSAAVTVERAAVDPLRKIAGGALVVLTGFLLSRLLGAVRNIVIAAHFGAGTEYGAYVAAIALPDLVFQVFVGGAVGAAFIPVFKRYHATNRDDEAWHLTSSVINIFFLVVTVTSVLLAIFARPIMDVWVAGPGRGIS